jgi:hypothetical protein
MNVNGYPSVRSEASVKGKYPASLAVNEPQTYHTVRRKWEDEVRVCRHIKPEELPAHEKSILR